MRRCGWLWLWCGLFPLAAQVSASSGLLVTNLAELAESPYRYWAHKIQFADEFRAAAPDRTVSISWKSFFEVQGRELKFYAPTELLPAVRQLYPGDRMRVEAMVRCTKHGMYITAMRIEGETRTITATAWRNGIIAPAGEVKVPAGGEATFTIQASPGCHIQTVLADDVPVGTFGPGDTAFVYTFSGVSSHHTIAATFGEGRAEPTPAEAPAAPAPVVITATAGENGSIEPAGELEVPAGGDATFAVTAAPQAHIESLSVDGEPAGAFDPGSRTFTYTFSSVWEPHSIAATFAKDRCSLTVQSFQDPVTPRPGTETYEAGTEIEARVNEPIVPVERPGARLACHGWRGGGDVPQSGTGTVVRFALTQDSVLIWRWNTEFELQVTAGPGGKVDGPSGWFVEGEQVRLRASADDGARFAGWTGDVPAGREQQNPLTVKMDGWRRLTANFEPVAATPTKTEAPAPSPAPVEEATPLPEEPALVVEEAAVPTPETEPAIAEESAPPPEEPAPAVEEPAVSASEADAAPVEPEAPAFTALDLAAEAAPIIAPEPAAAEEPVEVAMARAPASAPSQPAEATAAVPRIGVSTNSILISVPVGKVCSNNTFQVWNAGGGRMKYAISRDVSWFSVNPKIGTSTGEHDTIRIECSGKTLTPGTYTGTVTIAVRDADILPLELPVMVEITEK